MCTFVMFSKLSVTSQLVSTVYNIFDLIGCCTSCAFTHQLVFSLYTCIFTPPFVHALNIVLSFITVCYHHTTFTFTHQFVWALYVYCAYTIFCVWPSYNYCFHSSICLGTVRCSFLLPVSGHHYTFALTLHCV
jgi:hypothetical protein